MTSADSAEEQIAACLGYEVLRHPDDWLGGPSTEFLDAFLYGAYWRACCVAPEVPRWRISGVLEEPEFYKSYVEATGHPSLSIRWATAIAMTHFTLADGFSMLRDGAMVWHRKYGAKSSPIGNSPLGSDEFWRSFLKRPQMYMGGTSGWSLFCFLNGMDRGGDWLGLPEMPRLRQIFERLKSRSIHSYGSPFGAFRVYDAEGWLKYAEAAPGSSELS